MRAAHHPFGFRPDFAGNLEGVALLEFRQEKLDRERTGIPFLRELAENPLQRRHSVAWDEAGSVVQQLARDIGHILKMYVPDFAGLQRIQILEFVEAGPKVITIEHRPDVWMGGRSRHLQESRQRR